MELEIHDPVGVDVNINEINNNACADIKCYGHNIVTASWSA